MKHADTRRGRSRILALLAMIATLAAALAVSLGSVAQADTTATTDTNTRAVLDPATSATNCNPTPPAAAAAPCATSTNGATPQSVPPGPTVLAGAVGGDFVSIHVDGSAGTMFGVTRTTLCRGSLTDVSLSGQLVPSNGDCIPGGAAGMTGAEPGNGNHSAGGSSPPNTSVDYTYSIGEGTYTPPGGTAIECDAANPCNLWIQESVSNASDSSGFVFKHYLVTYAGAPGAPTVTSTPHNQSLAVTITPPANTGNTASPLKYTWTVSGGDCGGGTPPAGCGTPFTNDTATSHNLTLNNFQAYTISITATSTGANGTSTFTGPAGTAGPGASTTPVPPAPTNVQGTPANQSVNLTWTAPAGPAVTSYDVETTDTTTGGAPTVTNTGSSSPSFTVTGLTNGDVYTFRVRGEYSGTPGAYSAASAPITPQGKFITQTISVTRPQGDLVLTQVCGAHGTTTTGTAPTFNGGPDPLFSQYPYPTDANGVPDPNYPTNCGINLGTAHFKTSGTGAGQFFEATGVLNQVTVADTRDSDPGFTVNGVMGSFSDGGPNAHDSFSGSELGWTPVKTSDSPAFTASDGTHYDQTVSAGPVVAPNTPNATGLSSGAQLGSAPAGSGLGIAVLDANLDLFIPVYANHGVYTGVLTISAV